MLLSPWPNHHKRTSLVPCLNYWRANLQHIWHWNRCSTFTCFGSMTWPTQYSGLSGVKKVNWAGGIFGWNHRTIFFFEWRAVMSKHRCMRTKCVELTFVISSVLILSGNLNFVFSSCIALIYGFQLERVRSALTLCRAGGNDHTALCFKFNITTNKSFECFSFAPNLQIHFLS